MPNVDFGRRRHFWNDVVLISVNFGANWAGEGGHE